MWKRSKGHQDYSGMATEYKERMGKEFRLLTRKMIDYGVLASWLRGSLAKGDLKINNLKENFNLSQCCHF